MLIFIFYLGPYCQISFSTFAFYLAFGLVMISVFYLYFTLDTISIRTLDQQLSKRNLLYSMN